MGGIKKALELQLLLSVIDQGEELNINCFQQIFLIFVLG